MHFVGSLLAASLLFGSPLSAQADNSKTAKEPHTQLFWLNGKTHEFVFPSNYCPLADRGPERDFFNEAYDKLKGENVLLYIVIECQEKKDYFAGKRPFLDRYIQIQQITPKGNRSPINQTRSAFVSKNAFGQDKLTRNQIFEKASKTLADQNIGLKEFEMTPLGNDGTALFYQISSRLVTEGIPRNSLGIGAVTLVNKTPLSVIIHEFSGDPDKRKAMRGSLQVVLDSMLRYE